MYADIYIQTNVSVECNLCLALEETAANAQNFVPISNSNVKKTSWSGLKRSEARWVAKKKKTLCLTVWLIACHAHKSRRPMPTAGHCAVARFAFGHSNHWHAGPGLSRLSRLSTMSCLVCPVLALACPG